MELAWKVPLRVVHKTSSRLRLKPERPLIGNDFFAYEKFIDETFPEWEFRVNDHTQSFLILHDNQAASILQKIARKIPVLEEFGPRPEGQYFRSKLRLQLQNAVRTSDQMVLKLSRGELDLKTLAAISLFGMGYYQTFRRNRFLPAGETLFAAGVKFLLKP